MKITYIHHSSFLIETDSVYILFDYFDKPLPNLAEDKPLLIFASHRHGDHFSPVIFDIAAKFPQAQYILSKDISVKKVPEYLRDKVSFISSGAELKLDAGTEVTVKAYKSTDEGVAFLVSCDGRNIYHAGDLNNWRWKEEPGDWNDNVDKAYKKEIDKIAGVPIDLAFIPLDGRQEEWFYLGIDEFMTRVGANCVFPMHCWGDFSVIPKLKAMGCAQGYKDKIVEIHQDGESFII